MSFSSAMPFGLASLLNCTTLLALARLPFRSHQKGTSEVAQGPDSSGLLLPVLAVLAGLSLLRDVIWAPRRYYRRAIVILILLGVVVLAWRFPFADLIDMVTQLIS